jgi:hypothetical protein
VTGIQQQQRRDRGIDAARHCNDVMAHGLQLVAAGDDAGST